MKDNLIKSLETRLYRVPLAEVLTDAKHGDHSHFELVTATLTLADGSQGTGYTYTGGWGGHAIMAMLRHDLEVCISDQDATDIEALQDKMQWHIHYVGRGGIASFAISAIDNALWDLRGKRENLPLWKMAGGNTNSCDAYCGGIDLNFSKPKLLASIEGYLEGGYGAVKIKVGKPNLDEDIDRVASIRELIGPDVRFMVDANYGLDVDQAIAAANGFAPYDMLWFEEPIIPEDHAGYRRIASETDMPLAMGENQHTLHEFESAIDDANLSYLMPDAGNCGGISVFLEVAKMAEKKNVPVCSHGMQELSVSLLSGINNAGLAEVHSFPIHEYCVEPLVVKEERLQAPETPGIGVTLDWEKLEPHRQI